MNLRDEARQYFNETLGLTYQNLRKDDLLRLKTYLTKAFQDYATEVNVGPLQLSQKCLQRYSSDGTLKAAYFFVDSDYFEEREAISFNTDGFIGFCGWASDRNAKPFVEAFKVWCDDLNTSR